MVDESGVQLRSPIGSELHRFGLQRDRVRTALARRLGTTLRELNALEYLEAEGPMTQHELARRLVLTSGGATVLVDRMERAGLVERTPHPTDRRAVLVRLASGLVARAPQPLAAYHQAVASAANELKGDAADAVSTFLRAATAAAEKAADELSSPPR